MCRRGLCGVGWQSDLRSAVIATVVVIIVTVVALSFLWGGWRIVRRTTAG